MLIGYARVSTLDQSLDLQLDALKGCGCECVFTEKASGAKDKRPELAKALKSLREGDTLVVWKLDRLARSLKQLVETVEALHARGVALRSLTETIDTTTTSGRLVFHVFAALAEFERSVIRDWTLAGLAAARARGRRGGRPSGMTRQRMSEARQLLARSDLTVDQVAKRLNVACSTLYRHVPGGRSGVHAGPSGRSFVNVPPSRDVPT